MGATAHRPFWGILRVAGRGVLVVLFAQPDPVAQGVRHIQGGPADSALGLNGGGESLLGVPHLPVERAFPQQLVVGAAVGDPSRLQHRDLVYLIQPA
jgi:hypothetical protein